MKPENRNLILAVVLSMAVLFGWQIMVVQPEIEKEQARLDMIAKQARGSGQGNDSARPAAPEAGAIGTPKVAGANLAPMGENRPAETAKRVIIDAPLVKGSFSLQGARIDDIVLTGYRETLKSDSDNIHFLKNSVLSRPFLLNLVGRWPMIACQCQAPRRYGRRTARYCLHLARSLCAGIMAKA